MKTIEIDLLGDIPKNFTGTVHLKNLDESRTYKHGLIHSFKDQAAIFYSVGSWYGLKWYKNGKQHRGNGKPAVIRPDGTKLYYINDKIVTKVAAQVYRMLFKEIEIEKEALHF